MKKQIRYGVFESNSSSTHSITIMMKSDYDRWYDKNLFMFTGYTGRWKNKDKVPEKNHLYTKEEAIEFLKLDGYHSNTDFKSMNEEELNEILNENDFESYDKEVSDYLEYYEETFTTPSGEEIIAFGEYGYDG